MISLSAKHLLCHLNSQSETLPNQQFFFIVSAQKVPWKQNHAPELINADLKVPFQEAGLLGRNSSSLVWMRQLALLWSTVRQHLCHPGCSPLGSGCHHMAQGPALQSTQSLSALPAGHSLLFFQHLLQEGCSGSPFPCQQLWYNPGKRIFLCLLAMLVLFRVIGWPWRVSL